MKLKNGTIQTTLWKFALLSIFHGKRGGYLSDVAQQFSN